MGDTAGILFLLIAVFVGIVYMKTVAESKRIDKLPALRRRAHIVGKRTEVDGGHDDFPVFTSYFVTFELDGDGDGDGERIELAVKGEEYGMLAEDDIGELASQGPRFKGFERSA